MLPYRKENRGRNRKIKSCSTPQIFETSYGTANEFKERGKRRVGHLFLPASIPSRTCKKGVKKKYKKFAFSKTNKSWHLDGPETI